MEPLSETINTYSKNVNELSLKYDTLPPREEDVKFVFSHCGKSNPFVFEIGFGTGRDAAILQKYTNHYHGIDVSPGFVHIAKQKVPSFTFEEANVEDYQFPFSIDIVVAFASLLHVPKESIIKIMSGLFNTMNTGGLVYLSLKSAPKYERVVVNDAYGTRVFWYYSLDDVIEMASGFSVISVKKNIINNQDWIEVLYKKF